MTTTTLPYGIPKDALLDADPVTLRNKVEAEMNDLLSGRKKPKALHSESTKFKDVASAMLKTLPRHRILTGQSLLFDTSSLLVIGPEKSKQEALDRERKRASALSLEVSKLRKRVSTLTIFSMFAVASLLAALGALIVLR